MPPCRSRLSRPLRNNCKKETAPVGAVIGSETTHPWDFLMIASAMFAGASAYLVNSIE